MAVGKDIEKRGHVTGFSEEIEAARRESKDAFFTWFNDAKDAEHAFIKGEADFNVHIARPLEGYLKSPMNKVALEIGYGGGRLLAAASLFFGKVIGVDIHDCSDIVASELKARGIGNFELIKVDGVGGIPLKDGSVDVVYSFIVLQHVERIAVFEKYLKEAHRVLNKGGYAVIYFGRVRKFSFNRRFKILQLLDSMIEKMLLWKGFKEIPSRVNEINLVVSIVFVERLAKVMGFRICRRLVSFRRDKDGEFALYGGQNGLVLMKE